MLAASVRLLSENCLVTLRFSKNLNALPFRCLMNVSFRTRLGWDSGVSRGTFALAGVYATFFSGVMHHCVVRRSGSVPTEIAEPTREAQSSRHVCIETMQSKDFSENLVICVNFQTQSTDIQYLDSKIIYTISMRIRYFIGIFQAVPCGAGGLALIRGSRRITILRVCHIRQRSKNNCNP